MADTNISYAEIQSAASQLTSGESQINEILMQLQTTIGNLISNGFTTDSASGVFESAYQEFTAGVRSVVAGLTEMSSFLNSVASSYQDMDQSIASKISR
ncbi:MAG: WXG100 family type VII secretion target [Acidobacteriota bacterium]|nr:WXG100 family type VII secretion target [Acidobacteriota bacterium]